MKQLDLFGPRLTGRDVYGQARLNASVVPEDVPRLTAAQRRLWELMRDGAWYTTTDLERVGGRSAPQRVHEFKAAGIPYECERVPGGNGEHRWRLIASPTNGVET